MVPIDQTLERNTTMSENKWETRVDKWEMGKFCPWTWTDKSKDKEGEREMKVPMAEMRRLAKKIRRKSWMTWKESNLGRLKG